MKSLGVFGDLAGEVNMRDGLGLVGRILAGVYRVASRPFGPRLVTIVVWFAIGLFVYPMVGTPIGRRLAERKTLSYRMERLYVTLCGYAEAHDGKLPPAERWCDELMEYDGTLSADIFRDGFSEDGEACHMAFNVNVGDSVLWELSPNTVILFRAEGEWNLNGAEELVVQERTMPCLCANGEVICCRRVKDHYETSGVVGENHADIGSNIRVAN